MQRRCRCRRCRRRRRLDCCNVFSIDPDPSGESFELDTLRFGIRWL